MRKEKWQRGAVANSPQLPIPSPASGAQVEELGMKMLNPGEKERVGRRVGLALFLTIQMPLNRQFPQTDSALPMTVTGK